MENIYVPDAAFALKLGYFLKDSHESRMSLGETAINTESPMKVFFPLSFCLGVELVPSSSVSQYHTKADQMECIQNNVRKFWSLNHFDRTYISRKIFRSSWGAW